MFEQTADLGFLRVGAGFHLFFTGADFKLACLEHLKLLVHRRARGPEIGHPQRGVNLFGIQRLALLKPLIEVMQNARRLQLRLGRPHNGKLVAASQDVNPKLVLDLGEVTVELAAKVDQQPVIRKLKQRFMCVLSVGRG